MRKTILRKLACIGLLMAAAAVSACGSANKVAVVDVQKVQQDSAKIQSMVETQSAAVAKEKNIGIVMHKRVVPAGAVDITDEVLKKLNGVSDPSSTDKK